MVNNKIVNYFYVTLLAVGLACNQQNHAFSFNQLLAFSLPVTCCSALYYYKPDLFKKTGTWINNHKLFAGVGLSAFSLISISCYLLNKSYTQQRNIAQEYANLLFKKKSALKNLVKDANNSQLKKLFLNTIKDLYRFTLDKTNIDMTYKEIVDYQNDIAGIIKRSKFEQSANTFEQLAKKQVDADLQKEREQKENTKKEEKISEITTTHHTNSRIPQNQPNVVKNDNQKAVNDPDENKEIIDETNNLEDAQNLEDLEKLLNKNPNIVAIDISDEENKELSDNDKFSDENKEIPATGDAKTNYLNFLQSAADYLSDIEQEKSVDAIVEKIKTMTALENKLIKQDMADQEVIKAQENFKIEFEALDEDLQQQIQQKMSF